MAFIRFSRDKRGYEHLYLLEPVGRHEKSRTKILYWFRTPPGVRVGRDPFDESIRQALEQQYPGVSFDWKKLRAAAIPPPVPEVEHWRERRKAERAAKQAARLEAEAEAAAQGATEPVADASEDQDSGAGRRTSAASPQAQGADAETAPAAGQAGGQSGRRKRRRRRRGGASASSQAGRSSPDGGVSVESDSPDPADS